MCEQTSYVVCAHVSSSADLHSSYRPAVQNQLYVCKKKEIQQRFDENGSNNTGLTGEVML